MESVEDLIFAAWQRLAPRLEQDPALLAQRLARRAKSILTRPPRPWCLAVRASDHRIPTGCRQPAEHQVTLDAPLLRRICAHVYLDPPGQTRDEVAKKLGTSESGLLNARLKKTFDVHHIQGLGGRRGRPVPLLYTRQALDPSAKNFELADPLWASSVDRLADRVPPDLSQTLARVPYFRSFLPRHRYDLDRHPELDEPSPAKSRRQRLPPPEPDPVWYKWSISGHYLGDDPSNWRKGPKDDGERPPKWKPKPWRNRKRKRAATTARESEQFAGFHWLCPMCHQRCRVVYYPLPPINLLCGEQPLLADHIAITRATRGFACARCHRIVTTSRACLNGWNTIVTYLTAGLLYGREVPKPSWFQPQRKVAHHTKPNARPALRRGQILRRLLNGWTLQQIADDLHLKPLSVHNQMKIICNQERVADRVELAKKLGSPHPQPLSRNQLTRIRRQRILDLLLQGRSNAQIRQQLAVNAGILHAEMNKIFRAHGVQGRRGLEAKLGVTITPETQRRHEVRRRRAAGQTYKQIAAALGISFWTVQNHVRALKREQVTHLIAPNRHGAAVQ